MQSVPIHIKISEVSHRSPHLLHKQFLPFLQGSLQGSLQGDMTLPSPGHCCVPRVALENTLFWSDEGKNFTSHPTHQNQWKVDVFCVVHVKKMSTRETAPAPLIPMH